MSFYGLTGGICTGKSTVSKLLESLGAKIIDADEIAKGVVRKGSSVLEAIAAEFGKEILLEDRSLNREKIAQIVFSDREKLNKLNSLTHPEIISIIKKEKKILESSFPGEIIILDAPLLYETSLEKFVEKVIVVSASRDKQIERFMRRNNGTKEEAVNRINSQMPVEEKASRADFIIDNDGSVEDTFRQVRELYVKLISG